MTSRIMCSGLFPDSRKASRTLSRLASFFRLASLVASFISTRRPEHSPGTSRSRSISRTDSAPIPYFLGLRQLLLAEKLSDLQGRVLRIDDDVGLEVQDPLQIA
jgi:hypothetical protein